MKALLIKLIRQGLGQLVIFVDFMTRPQKMSRTDEQQAMVNEQVSQLALYQFNGCPFCVKVRREAHRLNLNLDLRDAKNNQQYRLELEAQGGRIKVPCLKIQQGDNVQWLYESSDINAYLDQRFGEADRVQEAT